MYCPQCVLKGFEYARLRKTLKKLQIKSCTCDQFENTGKERASTLTELEFKRYQTTLIPCCNRKCKAYLAKASLGDLNVTVSHLHVDPQAFHHWQAVLVVPQVLDEDR